MSSPEKIIRREYIKPDWRVVFNIRSVTIIKKINKSLINVHGDKNEKRKKSYRTNS